jgi:ribulose-phosphate 3-epimerase
VEEFDQILVMTVEPGFGGQSFIPSVLPKLAQLTRAVSAKGCDVWLQVDGGVTEQTIVEAAAAGADTFVAGSSVFGQANPAVAIDALRRAAVAHRHAR